MPATFFGIETARRGLKTHKHAQDITGHNLANASTPGYSRQEAVMKVTNPYTNPSFNSSATPGQFGTGVYVDKIRRIRDEYLDTSVRESNSANGYWQDQINFLDRAEAVFSEPVMAGMAGQITEFFKAWMNLNNTPQDPGTKAVVIEYGQEMAFMMSTAYQQLGDVHQSIAHIEPTAEGAIVKRGDLENKVEHVNELIQSLQDIEYSIAKIYRIGQQPNDLMDKRDMLLEEISHYMPIEVTYNNRPDQGLYGEIKELTIYSNLVDDENKSAGITIMRNGELVNPDSKFYLTAQTTPLGEENGLPEYADVWLNYGNVNADEAEDDNQGGADGGIDDDQEQDQSGGSWALNLTANQDNTALGGSIIGLEKARQNLIEYQASLNTLCAELKDRIAYTMAGREYGAQIDPAQLEQYFFSGTLADKDFQVYRGLHLNPSQLQGERAGEVASLRDVKCEKLMDSTFEGYYGMLVSQVGSAVDSVNSMAGNHKLINKQITALRDSVSGVSVDEELTLMIQYQYGFQASAKVVNTMDGMLDVIINRLF